MKGKKQIWTPSVSLPPKTTLSAKELKNFGEVVQETNKKNASLQSEPSERQSRGVIYLGHIPHGFYEEEMKAFFRQFGDVTRLRLSRSTKTAASRGYAFIEFAHEDVAKIVAETMNNYLMFDKLLKCQYLPRSQVHPKTFRRRGSTFWPCNSHVRAAKLHNRSKSKVQVIKSTSRLLLSKRKSIKKLAALGIEYELSGLESQIKTNKEEMKKISKKRKPTKSKKRSTETFSLLEDSSDDEIAFATPPNTVKLRRSKTPVSARSAGHKRPLSKRTDKMSDKEKKSKKPKLETKLMAKKQLPKKVAETRKAKSIPVKAAKGQIQQPRKKQANVKRQSM